MVRVRNIILSRRIKNFHEGFEVDVNVLNEVPRKNSRIEAIRDGDGKTTSFRVTGVVHAVRHGEDENIPVIDIYLDE